MVEQIDRDAAADRHLTPETRDDIRAGLCDDWEIVQSALAIRQAAEARMIARMRGPDAKMVEAVGRTLYSASGDNKWGGYSPSRHGSLATAALSAAADALETNNGS